MSDTPQIVLLKAKLQMAQASGKTDTVTRLTAKLAELIPEPTPTVPCCWFCGITEEQIEEKTKIDPPSTPFTMRRRTFSGYKNSLKPMLLNLHKCQLCDDQIIPSKMKLRSRQTPEQRAHNKFHKEFAETLASRSRITITGYEALSKKNQKLLAKAEAAGLNVTVTGESQ